MNKHFFLDGYNVNTDILSDVDKMNKLLNEINRLYFNNQGHIVLIPYFDGKIKEDGGVSGIVLGNNSHFTCHTFCYKNAMFVDYYGNLNNFTDILNNVLMVYPTDDYDLCNGNNNQDGNFGKHIIIEKNSHFNFDEAKKLIANILKDIQMTPINDVIINYIDDKNFDLLQPIAESHISIHQSEFNVVIDAFSCKWFDEDKLLKLVKSDSYFKVCRGVKYK